MEKNYYEILNVSFMATKEEIKKSYKRLAKKYHPDMNMGRDTKLIFQKITEAYTILSDENKRRNYDLSIPKSFQFKTTSYNKSNDDFDLSNYDLDDLLFFKEIILNNLKRREYPIEYDIFYSENQKVKVLKR